MIFSELDVVLELTDNSEPIACKVCTHISSNLFTSIVDDSGSDTFTFYLFLSSLIVRKNYLYHDLLALHVDE